MQALAREMNFSETVFVLPATDRRRRRADPHLHPGTRTAVRRPPDARERLRPRRAAPEDRDPARDRVRASSPSRSSAKARRSCSGAWSSRCRAGRRSPTQLRSSPRSGVESSGLPVERYDLGPGHVYVELDSPGAVEGLSPDIAALGRSDPGRGQLLRPRRGQPLEDTDVRPEPRRRRGSRDRLGRGTARDPPRPARPDRASATRSRSARERRSTGLRRCMRPSKGTATASTASRSAARRCSSRAASSASRAATAVRSPAARP